MEGRVAYANIAWKLALGYIESDLADLRAADLITGESQELYRQSLQQLLRGERVGVVEVTMLARDGRRVILEGNLYLRHENGLPVATRGVFRDVTELHRNKELRRLFKEKESRFQKAILDLHDQEYLNIQDFFRDLTQRTSVEMDVQRVGIWFFDDIGGAVCQSLFDQGRGGHQALSRRDYHDCPEYLNILKSDESLTVDDAEQDPVTARFWAESLRPLGITSLLDTPIRIRGEVSARLCIAHVGPPRHWDALEGDFSVKLANLIASLVQHFRRLEAETQLGNREAQLRLLVETSRAAIITVGGDGSITSWNPAAVEMFGYPPGEAIGMPVQNILPPSMRRPFGEGLAQTLGVEKATGKSGAVELQGWRKDGTELPMKVLVSEWSQDGTTFYSAILLDISERKRTDALLLQNQADLQEISRRLAQSVDQRTAELRESELRFRQLAENIDSVFWITDIEIGRIIYISPAFEKVWGIPRSRYYASRDALVETVHPADRPAVLAAIESSGNTGNYEESYRIIRPDGSIRWVSARGFPVRDASGNLSRMVGIVTDITRQKALQDALLASQTALRETQRFARLGSWEVDLASGSFKCSEELFAILEWHLDVNPPSVQALLGRIHSEERATVEDLLTTLPGNHDVYEAIHRLVFESDRTKFVQFRASVARDFRGRPEKLLGIIQDITELHLAEIERNRSQRLEALGQLAGGIAHDFNNALTPIVMTTSLLQAKLPAYQKPLATMERSAQRCAEMVKRLVLFARGEESEKAVLDPVALVDEMVKICRGTFPAGIEILRSPNATRSKIIADPTQIHQILLNLCVNARDAMPHGGRLELSISSAQVDGQASRLLPQARPGRYVIFSIRDSGCGMSQEVMDHIFEPFYTTKGPERGTGLGLSTAFRIVRAHGGFIQVKSAPGQGSEFLVYLPATDDPIPDVPPASPHAEAPPVESGRMILVVEDEEAIRKPLATALVDAGYQVLEARDGLDGLIQIAQRKFGIHLVVSDTQMPNMDGPDFVRALRQILPQVPVIITSGSLDDSTRQSLQSMGVLEIVAKPYDYRSVLQKIRTALTPRNP